MNSSAAHGGALSENMSGLSPLGLGGDTFITYKMWQKLEMWSKGSTSGMLEICYVTHCICSIQTELYLQESNLQKISTYSVCWTRRVLVWLSTFHVILTKWSYLISDHQTHQPAITKPKQTQLCSKRGSFGCKEWLLRNIYLYHELQKEYESFLFSHIKFHTTLDRFMNVSIRFIQFGELIVCSSILTINSVLCFM